ncbi:MAG: tRNA (cytidine(34)-2'-O)-methyltransferase [Christensenellales bacterium]|jgi:tRNA (cytidine/uridine-2'-O-)-methyltransferase
MPLHVVLLEPEIPQNTGNIARTCAATGGMLHLIEPMGFSIADRYLKRAGLDYWDKVFVQVHSDWAAFTAAYPEAELFLFSTKAARRYDQVTYPADAFLVFGRESRGLPEALLRAHLPRTVRIPMGEAIRSLNLSNSVAIAVYEALRQRDFPDMETRGRLAELER